MTTININENTSDTELYHQYQGQSSPQPCHVELDCGGGELKTDWNAEIGNAQTMDVYYGRTIQWTIPTGIKAGPANRLLAEIAPLAQLVLDGYSCEWDGSNNIGELTDDAEVACEQIRGICDDIDDDDDCLKVWQAGDWFSGGGSFDYTLQAEQLGITSETSDEAIAELAETESKGETPMSDLITGCEGHFIDLREHVIALAEGE